MSSYGGDVEINILSSKSCGVVGSVLLVLSLFLPVVTAKLELFGETTDESIYWKDSIFNIIAVCIIIFFYMFSIWTDIKWFMALVAVAMVRELIEMFRNYNEAQDRLDSLTHLLDSSFFSMTLKPGAGMICFILAMVAMLLGMFLAFKGE